MRVRERSPKGYPAVVAVAVLLLASCTTEGGVEPAPVAAPATDAIVEFVIGREGGLCVTKKGGTLCRVVLTVRDDGTWEATGVLPPAPAKGDVEAGAASRLSAILESGWEALTAQPFTGTCPSAYDGQELWYAVRRLPTGENAELADADVRELRACIYDLENPGARAVLERLEALWRELELPER